MNRNELRPSSRHESGWFYGYYIVIIAVIVMILTYGVRTSFGVFFKPIEADLGWSRALISGAVTFSVIVQGVWGIYMGRLNDQFGSRWVITLCSFFLGLGLLLMSLTHYSWQLYLFYGLIVGLGMGGVYVATLSTITRWFVKKRGLMTGIVMAGIGVGTITFAPVSNWLISLYDWRMSNIIIGGVVLVIGISVAQFLRRDPSQMGLLPYGQSENPIKGNTPVYAGLTLKEAAGTWQFWMATLIFVCVGYCTFTVNVHLVPHITDLGISSAVAASVLAVTGGMQSLGGILLGLAADKIGNRSVIIISLVLVSAALFWLIPISSILLFYLFAIIYSLGIGGSTAMESTITAELFGMRSHGVILGVMSFGFTIGGSIGPVITGYIFDLTSSYSLAFLVGGAVGAAGVVLTACIKSNKKLK